jgi:signal transduction histidine kinase
MADINENIQSVVALMKPQLKRGVTVETYCGDVPEFPMFPSELNQVMATLIKNANDAIDHAGRITITTTTAAHLVRVTVADTGRGIPEELQPRLFDVGFATKGTRFGMRIGLSAALDTVDKHGGRIEVANSAGSGTTFTVELPAR